METLQEKSTNKGRKKLLPPHNEFFLLLVRLRLGLFEQDLAYHFHVSQSTVSRIIITWSNFLYPQFKQIPVWPLRSLISSNIPQKGGLLKLLEAGDSMMGDRGFDIRDDLEFLGVTLKVPLF